MNFVLIITALSLLGLEMLYFAVARHFHIVDRPNQRSSHHRVALLGAGVAFYFAILLYALSHQFNYLPFLLGATLLGVVSYVDDLRPLPSWLRLGVQVAAIVLTFFPSIATSPPVTGSAPKMARTLSLRPEPSSPVKPLTSPSPM